MRRERKERVNSAGLCRGERVFLHEGFMVFTWGCHAQAASESFLVRTQHKVGAWVKTKPELSTEINRLKTLGKFVSERLSTFPK